MKQRLCYIDALRGFTMFLVVFWHVMTMTFGLDQFDTPCGYIFRSFRMPMFFFISGFVAYKPLNLWTSSLLKQRVIDKAKIQLIPTFVFFTIFQLFHGLNPWTEFITNGICGFWFTTTLFIMFLIYYAVIACTKHFNNEKLSFCILAVIAILIYTSPKTIGTDWYLFKILNLSGLVVLFQFFVTGLIVKAYYDKVKIFLLRDGVITSLMIAFTILLYILVNVNNGCFFNGNEIAESFVSTILLPYSGLFLVFSIFLSLEEWVNKQNWLSRSMQYVGRRTLDIYLLHYFLVPVGLEKIYEPIAEDSCVVLQFVLISSIATCVMCGCLAISALLRKSKFLGKNLFGVKYE